MFHNEFLFCCKKMYFSRDEYQVIKYSCRAGVGHLIAQNVCSRYFHKNTHSNPFPLK